ncbi:hypothetical protein [Neorhizobium galegae]|nr:hypothetical protein [Neorhizobium galegae]
MKSELLHSGQVDEAAYYGAMAHYLRLPLIAAIDPGSVADIPGLDTQLQRPNQVRINHRHQAPQVAVVPEARRLADLKAALVAMPLLGQDLAITIPFGAPRAVSRSGATRRVRETINGLFERFPEFSARVVLSGSQGFSAGLGLAALATALIATPIETLLFLHILLLIYFAFAAFNRQQFASQSLLRRVVRSLTDRARADQPLPRNPASDGRNYDPNGPQDQSNERNLTRSFTRRTVPEIMDTSSYYVQLSEQR